MSYLTKPELRLECERREDGISMVGWNTRDWLRRDNGDGALGVSGANSV